MQQIIKFIGKISFEGQMNDLPPEIYGFVTLQDANNKTVTDAIAGQFGRYREMGGMVSEKNQGAPINLQVTWLGHMYVPFNWIVSIQVALINLTQEISVPDEQGVERLSDGTKLVVN
jgi:hypothetical protein